MDYSNMYNFNQSYEYPTAVNMNNDRSNIEELQEYEKEDRLSALDEAIAEIKKSITGEKDDEIFYSVLLSQAPTEDDKKVIQSIINDEKKHNRLLKKLYQDLTKKPAPTSMMSRSNNSSSQYMKNLEKALFGELAAVEKYRKIMAAMPDKEKYAILMEIMTDEIRHAIKYNLLISKNMK